jgi:hypothetical protein
VVILSYSLDGNDLEVDERRDFDHTVNFAETVLAALPMLFLKPA